MTNAEKLADAPLYKSHKEVRALPVLKIFIGDPTDEGGDPTEAVLCTESGNITLSTRGIDGREVDYQVGGYVVRYDAGYVSYSPKDAFENGYSAVSSTRGHTKETYETPTVEAILDGEALQVAVDATPAAKVTEARLIASIKKATYHRLTGTLLVCVLELHNGFTVTGESACAAPENFRQDIGEAYAYKAAFSKLWVLFGFMLKDRLAAPEDRVVDFA